MTRYIQAMPLTQLVEAVRGAKERAERFRNDLQKSEALTRYALIDPILRALGWDTEDPSKVRPEFSTDSGTPDYALLWDGKPHIMVEAKALGKRLEGAQDKAFQYAWQNGVPYYVATDGLRWEVYDVYERDPKKRTLLQVDVGDSEPGTVARVLLALWRPAMPALEAPPQPVVTIAQEPSSGTPSAHAAAIFNLLELRQALRRGGPIQGSPPPVKVILPNRQEETVQSWRDLLLHVVAWGGTRLENQLPVILPRTGKVIVGKENSGMRSPRKVGSMWVETHASAHDLVKFACLALEKIGQDPASAKVLLRE